MKNTSLRVLGISTFACLLSSPAIAQQDFSKVEITTTELSSNVYMMTGAGGNLGVSIGDDGVFLIDDQFAPLSEKISAAIAELTDKPVTYVLNTHWHFDHTGGNENFGQSGAVIVSHANVRKRMSTDQLIKAFDRAVPASPAAALPVITFTEDATFYFNDTEIQIVHHATAHTDGDSVVMFKESNVVHVGDIFFNGFFPFIDESSGGTLEGVINAVTDILPMVDDETKIIPGHGPLANKADLTAYLEMLKEVRTIMRPLAKGGQSREEVLSANPLAGFEEDWGGGFLKVDVFTGIVYDIEAAS
ncbi:MBL fold metallo-hydrolase [Pelagibius litoralis]|uniref:MBL fold metallo-hydrolase n=1 Tax=Pelagibius litoralis TaxID=374515 RepID=A0A967C6V3_9PROT|nr:MBL fold metallo-hydrolase [Pelagibius litoralis]NIA67662.1 MBL fold metallo-hydrolase [Pelagibius litoralis]